MPFLFSAASWQDQATTCSWAEDYDEKRDPILKPTSVLGIRVRLLEMGYEPIPVVTRDKRTFVDGWPEGDYDLHRVEAEYKANANHRNTGLRTGKLVLFDNDLVVDAHANIIRALVEREAGNTAFKRRGAKGVGLCYRNTEQAINKIKIVNKGVEEDTTLVEVLGWHNQFVSYGIHPKTGKPYQWLEADPLLVPFSEVPAITVAEINRVALLVERKLCELGYTAKRKGGEVSESNYTPPGKPEDAADITGLFMALIPHNAKLKRGWYSFSCPECRHSDNDSGFRVLGNGGWEYHCFHASCEFNKTTGWHPPRQFLGPREKRLYAALGGNPDDLNPHRLARCKLKGYQDSLEEMIKQCREFHKHD